MNMNNFGIGNIWSLIIAKSLLSLTLLIAVFLTFSQFSQASNGSSIIIPVPIQEVFVHVNSGTTIAGQENISFSHAQAILYVAPNTLIYGEVNFSNAKVIRSSTAIVEKNSAIDHQRILGTSKEFVITTPKDKAVQNLQDRLNKEIKNTVYTSKSDQEYYKWADIILSKQISSHTSSFKAVSTVYRDENENAFASQVTKHKFYTSLCFLEFTKLRNDVLRGPPSI